MYIETFNLESGMKMLNVFILMLRIRQVAVVIIIVIINHSTNNNG